MSQEEIISKNWEVFKTQIQKLDTKTPKIKNFIDALEEADMPIAPASTRTDLVCSYPGGLVEHSLRVLSYFAKLRKVFNLEKEITAASAITLSLLHDVGKLGEGSKAYYLPQEDEWKRNKLGQNYEINPKLVFMPVSQLSLRWLTFYSINLDLEEWYSISNVRETSKEQYTTKNEPKISVILNQAITMACIDGKMKKEASLIKD